MASGEGRQTMLHQLAEAAADGLKDRVAGLLAELAASSDQPLDTSALHPALMAAADWGHTEVIQQLLDAGADATDFGADSRTALMRAAAAGHADAVAMLLQAGAPWNAIDPSGNCAGDYAMQGGHEAAAEVLLEAGCRAELVLGLLERRAAGAGAGPSNSAYLQQRVTYEGSDKLLDAESKGVMMAWEGPLMEAHAQAICSSGGDVLNIGFGMGMVDTAIQKRKPHSHTIIEAHRDVHARMLADGWDRRPGVRVVFGRWQDVLPQLGQFDGIFFDTYGEYYGDMRDFHALLPKLLRPGGIYSFFNGLCADNAFFHAVYCRLVASELAQKGLATQYVPLPVNVADAKIWEGVGLRYWQLDTYYLPVCQWDSEVDDEVSS